MPTIADGLAGGIGKICFEVAQKSIDDVIVVEERRVREAVAELVTKEQLLVEGSGGIGVAALLHNSSRFRGRRVAIVLSGSNIDPRVLVDCLCEGQGEHSG